MKLWALKHALVLVGVAAALVCLGNLLGKTSLGASWALLVTAALGFYQLAKESANLAPHNPEIATGTRLEILGSVFVTILLDLLAYKFLVLDLDSRNAGLVVIITVSILAGVLIYFGLLAPNKYTYPEIKK